jgi:hypothetical protein
VERARWRDRRKEPAHCAQPKIIQTRRASFWKKGESSTLILTFEKAPGGAAVDLVHVGVPEHDQKGVRNGWPSYYWKRWKKHLASKKKA